MESHWPVSMGTAILSVLGALVGMVAVVGWYYVTQSIETQKEHARRLGKLEIAATKLADATDTEIEVGE